MNSKYKVGDKVKIRDGLEDGEMYGNVVFVYGMKKHKEITISRIEIKDEEALYVSDNNYYYTEEMIEGLVSNNKYKVGDRVKVKGDLVVGERYGGTMFASGMKGYREITIRSLETRIDGKCVYISEEDRYCYTDEMIEGLALNNKYNIGDRVRIKENLVVGKYYGSNSFVENMKPYEEITIKKVLFYDGNIEYISEENYYYYTDEMIEGLIEEEKGDVDMKTRLNIIEAGNMPVGTRFRLFDKEGNEENLIAEVVESKDNTSNKFLAWDGNYEAPLTLADTNVNCYFEVIIDDEKDEWEKVDFMTAVKHHYDNGTVRWGKGDNEVIYDGYKSTYFEPLSGRKQDGISSYKIMHGSWWIKAE